MKVKSGPLFKRISQAHDYQRLGKENWENLKGGKVVEGEPSQELLDKGYLIETTKQKHEKKSEAK